MQADIRFELDEEGNLATGRLDQPGLHGGDLHGRASFGPAFSAIGRGRRLAWADAPSRPSTSRPGTDERRGSPCLTPPEWPAEPLRRQAPPDPDRARSCSTSTRRRILPDALLGICATSSQRRIRLYGAIRSAANARMSSTATAWSFSTR